MTTVDHEDPGPPFCSARLTRKLFIWALAYSCKGRAIPYGHWPARGLLMFCSFWREKKVSWLWNFWQHVYSFKGMFSSSFGPGASGEVWVLNKHNRNTDQQVGLSDPGQAFSTYSSWSTTQAMHVHAADWPLKCPKQQRPDLNLLPSSFLHLSFSFLLCSPLTQPLSL